MNQDSNRKLAAITGASSGIGLELAKQFASNGFDLVICSDSPAIQTAAHDLEALGASVSAIQVDLAKYEGVEKFYGHATSQGRALDAVAINAGVGVGGDFARQTDLDAELNLIELNVTSTVHLAKRVVKDMVARGEGRILFTASVASTMPGPFEAVYAASKAFVYSFAQAIRGELKETGVSVTALLPGPTETNFFHRAGMDDTKVGADKKDDPAEVAKDGFEALMSGKDHVVGGSFKNQLQVTLGSVIPDTAKAAMHRNLAEPGSANQ